MKSDVKGTAMSKRLGNTGLVSVNIGLSLTISFNITLP
jgi:hypothetical protein